jgi:antitoxin (DNA-binding transcriptional repressor) of toxin-antitoxin stability system
MKVNALQIRNSLGRILETLKKNGEPIIIEKGREPVAVLISLEAFKERFVDYREEEKRRALVDAFRDSATKPSADSLKTLRALRYGPGR